MAREGWKRPSSPTRRFGYAFAVAVNAALLWAINVWPGWEKLSFLTGETPDVLGLVNLSLWVGIVINAIYLAYDPPVVAAFGDLVNTAIASVVLVRIWQVFPFAFDSTFDWATVVRVVLVVGIVGSCIAVVVHLGRLLARLARAATGIGDGHIPR